MTKALTLATAAIVTAATLAPAAAHDVTAKANNKIVASFDLLTARAESKSNQVTFIMSTRGTAGAKRPAKTGKFAGAAVYAYVWPTKVDPEASRPCAACAFPPQSPFARWSRRASGSESADESLH